MERKEIDNLLNKHVSDPDVRDILTSQLLDLFHGELDTQKNLLDSEREKNKAQAESLKQLQSDYDAAVKNSENIEALKGQISNLKANQKQELARIQQDYENRLIQSAIDVELTKAGAKNTKAAAALLDTSVLKMVDGSVLGLTEMINKIKSDESTSFLFEQPEAEQQFVQHNYIPQGSVEKTQTSNKEIDQMLNNELSRSNSDNVIQGW